MKLTLHHINLSTQQVEVMDEFYRDVIGLHTETDPGSAPSCKSRTRGPTRHWIWLYCEDGVPWGDLKNGQVDSPWSG